MRSRAFFMSLVVLLGGAPMSPGSLTASDVPVSWTWQPRAESITIERVENETPRGGGASLRVLGRIDSGWNYIASNRSPVTPGTLYRLSVRLRVDRLGPGTPWPYVKCEFVPDRPGRPLMQIHTDPYDCSRLGQWQELTTEFRVPDGAPFLLAGTGERDQRSDRDRRAFRRSPARADYPPDRPGAISTQAAPGVPGGGARNPSPAPPDRAPDCRSAHRH